MAEKIEILIEEVEDLVSRVGTSPVWGYNHCLRVYDLAEDIGREEGLRYDPGMLRLAALLHDIGLYKAYNLREASDHAERSADVAGRILRDRDFPMEDARVIIETVRNHPPGMKHAEYAESALLNDAVALDYLGAIGVSRVLAMVGTEEDVPDIATAISHAEGLRRSLPDTLTYEASRYIAEERVLEMDDFLEGVRRSTGNLKLL